VYPKVVVPEIAPLPSPPEAVAKLKLFGFRKKKKGPKEYQDTRIERHRLATQLKVLFVGLPQSGKTTCLKQLQIIYGNGFSDAEREEFRRVCLQNAYAKVSPYFVENADRISREDWELTYADILRCCARTMGVRDVEFDVEGLCVLAIELGHEVGGVRKIISSFEDVTALVYVADLGNLEQLPDAIYDFENHVQSRWFMNMTVLLFLNKVDLFQMHTSEKFAKIFPEFVGDEFTDRLAFVKEKFLSVTSNARVYVHNTITLDSCNFQMVFSAVRGEKRIGSCCLTNASLDTLVSQSLSFAGLGSDFSGVATTNIPAKRAVAAAPPSREPRAPSPAPTAGARALTAPVTSPAAPGSAPAPASSVPAPDVSSVALVMNELFDRSGSALRQTIVHVAPQWHKRDAGNFLGPAKKMALEADAVRGEHVACMGLLDCLTRGGCLSLGEEAELHVVFVATHDYTKSIIETVVQESRNPIEELEADWRLMIQTISNL
jgi:hypothetical protein